MPASIPIAAALILLLLMVSASWAEGPGPGNRQGPRAEYNKVVTPYGDFCPLCSMYGKRKRGSQVRMHEAARAARDYFHIKGMTVRNIKGKRRFLKMDIYKDDTLVDTVVFDRMSGRLRSID